MKKLNIFLLMIGASFSSMGQMPANNANPYDIAGEVHNDIFNYVKDNPPKVINRKSIALAIDEYLKEHGSNFQASALLLSQTYIDFAKAFNSANDKEQFLINEGGFSEKGAGYYTLLIDALRNLDYETIFNSMIILEERIAKDQELNNIEKRVLLSSCSVGRHSAYNWINNTSGSSTDQETGWTADVKGAMEGGLVGALGGGTATLGTAIVPSWLAGVVTGGIGASLIALYNIATAD